LSPSPRVRLLVCRVSVCVCVCLSIYGCPFTCVSVSCCRLVLVLTPTVSSQVIALEVLESGKYLVNLFSWFPLLRRRRPL